LADRLSFRRFCGYGLDEATPDETTICRFRNALAAVNVLTECFAEVNAQLDRKGLILRKGTIVDAGIIASASRRPDLKQGKGNGRPRRAGRARTGAAISATASTSALISAPTLSAAWS
jgi:IS5 family transposase